MERAPARFEAGSSESMMLRQWARGRAAIRPMEAAGSSREPAPLANAGVRRPLWQHHQLCSSGPAEFSLLSDIVVVTDCSDVTELWANKLNHTKVEGPDGRE